MYIRSNLRCTVVNEMTSNDDNELEMITVEIILPTVKNIVISCVYRPPESCVTTFVEKFTEKVEMNKNKTQIICGDFNINLENVNEQKTTDFLHAMNSLGLFPLITKPTRITSQSATLIDNIFTNINKDIVMSGIFMADISDHLPIFTVVKYDNNKKTTYKTLKLKRNRSKQAIEKLNNELKEQKQENVSKMLMKHKTTS